MKRNWMRFALGAILFLAGWWASIDNAEYFPEVLDPNNAVTVLGTTITLSHHWVIGMGFAVAGLIIMAMEVFGRGR